MKKLLSLVAAAAMALGLVSCSGDLHDDVKVDPNAMTGYWSYILLDDVSTCTSGKIAVITSFNSGTPQSGAYGSDPYLIDATAGTTSSCIWSGKGGEDIVDNTRTDCPTAASLDITIGSDQVCLFVFTTAKKCNIWAYDSADSTIGITGSDWPGLETTATVSAEYWTATYKGIKVVNAPTIGEAGYLAFCDASLPGNAWDSTTPNKIEELTSGAATLTFATTAEIKAEVGATTDLSVQVLNPASDTDFWADESKISCAYDTGTKIDGGSVTATASESLKGKNVYLVITWKDVPATDTKDYVNNSYCEAAFVAE